MISKIFDHVTHKYFNGYYLLIFGWSDGTTFIPVDFSLAATVSNFINDFKETIDKRTIIYKRRTEVRQKKTDTIVEMIKRVIDYAIYVSYVFMDTWFASPAMFMKMKNISIDAVCMLKKATKQQ